VADTELAQLFAIAADQIEHWQAAESDAAQDDAPRLLWIHARGYRGAWDAPLELRQSLLDEEDPAPSENVVPPSRLESSDHDELLLHRAAYAAQTIVLDECVGMLLAALEAAGIADSTLVALIGCRGFALGEHGVVGADALNLYSEITHVPLLIRLPGGEPAPPPRLGNMAQPCDLRPILLKWFEASIQDASSRAIVTSGDATSDAARETTFSIGPENELALRTDSWALRRFTTKRPDGSEAPAVELFSKPDDRWEANEIADRCPEEAASLLAIVDEFLAQAASS
jgi:arylsulfatase A-like enzyme